MTIGERIKLKRREKGWSQRELSVKLGYSHHSTIGKIENNLVDLSQTRIQQFADVLGVSVAYLMGWDEKKESTENDGLTKDQKQLIEFAYTVPEDKAKMILKVMRSILEDEK